jgi:hypothetical protein
LTISKDMTNYIYYESNLRTQRTPTKQPRTLRLKRFENRIQDNAILTISMGNHQEVKR